MQARTLAASLCGAAVFLAATLWWAKDTPPRASLTGTTTERDQPHVSAASATTSRDWQRMGHQSRFVSGLEQLPASLQGTTVPEGLQVDANGSLILSPALRDIFDYFLSVLGEEDIDTVVARIRAYLDDQLPPGAAAEAQRILEDYLAFRDSLADLLIDTAQARSADADAIRQHQRAIRDRRQQFLEPAVDEAFFAAQDRWDDYGLSRLEVMTDETLTAQEKASTLSTLREQLPQDMRADVDAVMRHQDLKALTQQLTEAGGSDTDLRLLREQVVGAEAADRLETLDAERAQFQQRVDSWLDLRARTLANEALASADREQQVTQLRLQYFTEQEQMRVTTLEQLHDAQAMP